MMANLDRTNNMCHGSVLAKKIPEQILANNFLKHWMNVVKSSVCKFPLAIHVSLSFILFQFM